ncbi:MAG: peptidoglycan recognition protein family protein, partial [Gammaproteobacteria bacterium]
RIRVLSRSEWGASKTLPRRGHRIGPARRTEVFIHHTTVVDRDTTVNEWENISEVKARMRQLQTIRPDLGADVPYSMVAFCMANGELVLCEGRGLERTGAHTHGHNRSALGIAFQGNFQRTPLPRFLDQQLTTLSEWLRELRSKHGFVNLGSVRPRDREVWSHSDVKSTQCCGRYLINRLGLIRFLAQEDDEMKMDQRTWKTVQRSLQALSPPLYAGRTIDGKPGRNTSTAVKAFERRVGFASRGVLGTPNDPEAGMWPATRELLFVHAFSRK